MYNNVVVSALIDTRFVSSGTSKFIFTSLHKRFFSTRMCESKAAQAKTAINPVTGNPTVRHYRSIFTIIHHGSIYFAIKF